MVEEWNEWSEVNPMFKNYTAGVEEYFNQLNLLRSNGIPPLALKELSSLELRQTTESIHYMLVLIEKSLDSLLMEEKYKSYVAYSIFQLIQNVSLDAGE